jgi:hypothetical protein
MSEWAIDQRSMGLHDVPGLILGHGQQPVRADPHGHSG